MRHLQKTAVLITAIALPVVVLADMPMALFYGISRIFVIPIVLIVEWIVLAYFFDFTWGRAAIASLAVNAVTYIVGIFAFPILGMMVYGSPLIDLIGKFIIAGSYGEYLFILFVAALVDTAIELSILKGGFKRTLDKRRVIIWFLANLATAGFLLIAIGVEVGWNAFSG